MSGTNPGSTSSPFNQLLEVMARHKASDLFISVGSPVQMKINGNMVAVTAADKRLMPQQAEALLRSAINDQQWRRFQEENELNIGYGVKDVGSFRISLFRQRGTAAAVVRYIPGDIPEFDTLGMPPVLKELILQPRGLFLMVGATGVGKTTTLASLIDYRNANRTGHILTLEDPIEFVFRNQQSIVNQRQIGSDTKDLHTALKSALRQAPDCILIGEIRDMEAMGAAIAYAQSGHLVLATLHANNAAHALNRILSFYAPENRGALLADLSTTLKAIVSQRLLASTDGGRGPGSRRGRPPSHPRTRSVSKPEPRSSIRCRPYRAAFVSYGEPRSVAPAMSRRPPAGGTDTAGPSKSDTNSPAERKIRVLREAKRDADHHRWFG